MGEPARKSAPAFDRKAILGGRATDWKKLRSNVQRGLPLSAFDGLAEWLDVEPEYFIERLGGANRTLQRWRKLNQPLSPPVSDRLTRYVRISEHAAEVFENRVDAMRWLKAPNPALGGEVPLDILDTDAGAVEVDALLTRIEDGVYS